MSLTELHLVIMNRFNCTVEIADEFYNEMRQRVKNGENPEEVLDEIGIEHDYLFDLL